MPSVEGPCSDPVPTLHDPAHFPGLEDPLQDPLTDMFSADSPRRVHRAHEHSPEASTSQEV